MNSTSLTAQWEGTKKGGKGGKSSFVTVKCGDDGGGGGGTGEGREAGGGRGRGLRVERWRWRGKKREDMDVESKKGKEVQSFSKMYRREEEGNKGGVKEQERR